MNTAEKKPKYLRVVEHLRLGIESGQWSPGEMLPIESELAASLGMARNTVRQGLSRLEQDGVIERVQGRGTFVTTPQQRPFASAARHVCPHCRSAPRGVLSFADSGGSSSRCTEVAHQAIIGCSRNDIHVQADLILQNDRSERRRSGARPRRRLPPRRSTTSGNCRSTLFRSSSATARPPASPPPA